jgi:hypothetical protein
VLDAAGDDRLAREPVEELLPPGEPRPDELQRDVPPQHRVDAFQTTAIPPSPRWLSLTYLWHFCPGPQAKCIDVDQPTPS